MKCTYITGCFNGFIYVVSPSLYEAGRFNKILLFLNISTWITYSYTDSRSNWLEITEETDNAIKTGQPWYLKKKQVTNKNYFITDLSIDNTTRK